MSVLSALGRMVTRPPTISRQRALTLVERFSAYGHLVSNLEYLASPQDRRPGGLNDWAVSRRNIRFKSRWMAAVVGSVSRRGPTAAIHMTQVAASALLLAPTGPRARLWANVVLTAGDLALSGRRRFGTDGSDQARLLAQAAAAIARGAGRHPGVADAALWFLGAQSTLSYAVSGWAKLAGPLWRSGEALPGIMRTMTYGNEQVWRLMRRYPHTSRALGASVLALECLFPLAYSAGGRPARAMVAAAAAFHVANARLMGLNRFLPAFVALHPAVLYTAGPAERRGQAPRDDLAPAVMLAIGVVAGGAAAVSRARVRRAVAAARPGDRTMTSPAGHTLVYRSGGPPDRPLVILEAGLAAPLEQWEWIRLGLAKRYRVVSYDRAGYARSSDPDPASYDLGTSVSDLVALVREVAGNPREVAGHRPVVLLGHSLGGHLAWQAAERAPDVIRAVVLVDASHPAELVRSRGQQLAAEHFDGKIAAMARNMRYGMGLFAGRPGWVRRLPEPVRERAYAQFRDDRMWRAAYREWAAMRAEFASAQVPAHIKVPALVLTAGLTAQLDPVQAMLHDELAAAAAPTSRRTIIDGASHASILTDRRPAGQVVAATTAFLDDVLGEQVWR